MFIFLRAQDLYWMTVALVTEDGKILKIKRMDSRPEAILSHFWSLLNSWGVEWKQISELWTVSGPGSFTALRQSHTIINSIAFVHQMKLRSIIAKPTETDEVVIKKMLKIKPKKNWLIPVYGQKPMITQSKSSVKN